MSSINMREIFSRFFSKVEGYDLFNPSMSEEMRNEFLCSYLHSALSDRYVSQLFSSIEVLDSTVEVDEGGNVVSSDGEITFTLKYTIDEFSDSNFLIEMLAYGMALAWVTPKINTVTTIQQYIGTAQDKIYSQSNHLTALLSLQERLLSSRNQLIADRGVINNDYLDGNSHAATLRSA